MTQTEVQKIQIEWETSEWETRLGLMYKTFALVNPRMNKLWQNELYLETVLVFSQTVEHYIKAIIQGYLVKRRILAILGENDPRANVKIDIDEETPLGSLIGNLKQFIGKNALVAELTNFNIKIRREVAHHIFDGSRDIEPLNDDIKVFFGKNWQGKEFTSIVQGLKSELTRVDTQVKELVKKSS